MKKIYVSPGIRTVNIQPVHMVCESKFNNTLDSQSITISTAEEADVFTSRRRSTVWDDEYDY